jgi:hypothetical protein
VPSKKIEETLFFGFTDGLFKNLQEADTHQRQQTDPTVYPRDVAPGIQRCGPR